MRQTFSNQLPKEIIWRKDKIGYEPPQKNWMDNNSVKERINNARKTLVQNQIIDKSILDSPITSEDAVKPGVLNNWGQLLAAKLFE